MEAVRSGRLVWWGLFFLCCLVGAARANVGVRSAHVYVRGDSLNVDISLDSLFSTRSVDAIETGMATTIALEFRVVPSGGRRPLSGKSCALRLDHDIWEGEYQVIRHAPPADTLKTVSFVEAIRFCAELDSLPVHSMKDLDRLPKDLPLMLQMRAAIDPVTPEQEARTKHWLNILQRGSLLEFFISFESASETTPWLDLRLFRLDDLSVAPDGLNPIVRTDPAGQPTIESETP